MYLLLNRYMNMYNLIIRPLLFCIDPEKVHRMLLSWLKFYRYLFPVRACVRGYSRVSDPFSYGHLQFKNRIGLSAGFDKNAEAFDELADFGFGFLEVGTVTPDSQSGNPSPRIFRLVDDESLISRTGFNNCGVDAVRQHIRKYRKHSYVLGVNINKNPLSTGDQIIKDFESTFIHLYDCVDYFTLNWGSIDNDLFAMVLEKLTIFRQAANKRCSIFIKLPADIDEKALSYGEIKALATGNPLILEKTNLDSEISKLKLLKQSFMNQKYALQDKVIKYYPEEITRLNNKIAAMEEDTIKLQEYTRPNIDGFSPMIIDGKEYLEKANAGKKLLECTQLLKSMEVKEIGEYRGFKMEIRLYNQKYKIKAKE